MKIAIIGGHLSPALSVISELEGNEILYFGREFTFEADKTLSLEYKTIKSLGIPFYSITTGRLQRRFTSHTISSFFKLPIGFSQSLLRLLVKRPDVVVGFGGYVELPVIFAAWILRIPILIHEQTLGAGLANKIASRFARKICISWESSRRFFPKEKTVITGNPIRQEILNIESFKNKNKRPLVYITGGSSGSHVINSLVEGSIKRLVKEADVVHQTGDAQKFKDFEKLEKVRSELPKNLRGRYKLHKFISAFDVARLMNKADLIVSRAGINTISEVVYLNKPSLFIPLSYGLEQKQNANYVRELGLGEIGLEEKLTSSAFFDTIMLMLKNIEKYKAHRNILVKNAAWKIREEILNVGKKT